MCIRKVFGDNVRKLRLAKGMSQEKFANVCGLHRTYISDLECYRRNVSIDNIQIIAKSLGVNACTLLMKEMKNDE